MHLQDLPETDLFCLRRTMPRMRPGFAAAQSDHRVATPGFGIWRAHQTLTTARARAACPKRSPVSCRPAPPIRVLDWRDARPRVPGRGRDCRNARSYGRFCASGRSGRARICLISITTQPWGIEDDQATFLERENPEALPRYAATALRLAGGRALADPPQLDPRGIWVPAHERTCHKPMVKGWCPGAHRPMLSGDGLVCARAPLSAAQLTCSEQALGSVRSGGGVRQRRSWISHRAPISRSGACAEAIVTGTLLALPRPVEPRSARRRPIAIETGGRNIDAARVWRGWRC